MAEETVVEMMFNDALYKYKCECGDVVPWEANFDADGTTYSARCCGFFYYMAPSTVRVSKEAE